MRGCFLFSLLPVRSLLRCRYFAPECFYFGSKAAWAAKPCGDWWGVEFNPGEAASRRINGRLLQPKKSLANPPSYWGYNKRNKHKLWKLFIRFRSCFLFGEFRSVVVYFSPQGSWTSWWTCSYPIRSSETRRQRKDGSHQKIVSTAFFTLTPSLDDCRT